MQLNNSKRLITLVFLFAVVMLWLFIPNKFDQVKSGEYHLVCDIKDKGFVDIDPNLLVDLIDDVWVFENGYSKKCTTIKADK